jgi:hypothetical protein
MRTGKGNVIIGIAIAAIALASMVGSVAAYSNGGPYNIIKKDGATAVQPVLIGQDLSFPQAEGWGADLVTIFRVKDGSIEWTRTADSENILTITGGEWLKDGAYYVNYNKADGSADAQLSFSQLDMPLAIKVGTKKVSSVAVGTSITVTTAGINLFEEDAVDLTIIGPLGQVKRDEKNNQQFTGITVKDLKINYGADNLKTTGWTIGDYTFQITAKEERASGLDAASEVVELKIIKGAITIDASTTDTVELETVTLTVTGVADDPIKLSSSPLSDNVEFRAGIDDTPTGAHYHGNWFEDIIDKDGKRTYAVRFTDTGTYTIRVEVTGGDRKGDYDTVDITVAERSVDFDLPSTMVIGGKLLVKGTATSGTYVSVYIDDVLYQKLTDLVIEDGGFSKEVKTTEVGMDVPGSVRLKAWIDAEKKPGEVRPTRSPDGEAALLLTKTSLEAELSVSVVALGDDFTVKGTSQGADNVNIFAISPKGSGGTAINTGVVSTNYAANIFSAIASVSTTDHTFEQKIDVTENADTGTYVVAVLSPGGDGIYNGLPGDVTPTTFPAAFAATYNLPNFPKTQAQIIAMAGDATIDAPGSDDLAWLDYIAVQSPFVLVDTPAHGARGEPLIVTGTSNRKEGSIVMIDVKGPVALTPQTAPVTKGTFSATFDTSAAEAGTYTVTADDGDGHVDEVEVNIGAVAPTPSVSTPQPTPLPTVAPTPTPTPRAPPTSTLPPNPPGFEMIFAVTGLLAVAYGMFRMKN